MTSSPGEVLDFLNRRLCQCEAKGCRTLCRLAKQSGMIYSLAGDSEAAEMETLTVNLPSGPVEFIVSAMLTMHFGTIVFRFDDAEGLAAVKEVYGYESSESTGTTDVHSGRVSRGGQGRESAP